MFAADLGNLLDFSRRRARARGPPWTRALQMARSSPRLLQAGKPHASARSPHRLRVLASAASWCSRMRLSHKWPASTWCSCHRRCQLWCPGGAGAAGRRFTRGGSGSCTKLCSGASCWTAVWICWPLIRSWCWSRARCRTSIRLPRTASRRRMWWARAGRGTSATTCCGSEAPQRRARLPRAPRVAPGARALPLPRSSATARPTRAAATLSACVASCGRIRSRTLALPVQRLGGARTRRGPWRGGPRRRLRARVFAGAAPGIRLVSTPWRRRIVWPNARGRAAAAFGARQQNPRLLRPSSHGSGTLPNACTGLRLLSRPPASSSCVGLSPRCYSSRAAYPPAVLNPFAPAHQRLTVLRRISAAGPGRREQYLRQRFGRASAELAQHRRHPVEGSLLQSVGGQGSARTSQPPELGALGAAERQAPGSRLAH